MGSGSNDMRFATILRTGSASRVGPAQDSIPSLSGVKESFLFGRFYGLTISRPRHRNQGAVIQHNRGGGTDDSSTARQSISGVAL